MKTRGKELPAVRMPRALIFDDDEFIRELLTTVFSQKGFEVLAYGDPTKCPVYDHATCGQKSRCADLLITDLSMPRMNGIEFLQKQVHRGCRLEARNKAIISGHFQEQDIRTIRKLGCSLFQKPVGMKDLSEWIDECRERMDLTDPLEFIERRIDRRVAHDPSLPCSVETDPEELLPGTVINTSTGGLCIEIPRIVREGTAVRVRSALAEAGRRAVVRWSRQEAPGRFLAGLLCQQDS